MVNIPQINTNALQASYKVNNFELLKLVHCQDVNAEKREPLRTVDGSVNWCSHCGQQYGSSSRKLKIELPYVQQFHFWLFIQRNQKQ